MNVFILPPLGQVVIVLCEFQLTWNEERTFQFFRCWVKPVEEVEGSQQRQTDVSAGVW